MIFEFHIAEQILNSNMNSTVHAEDKRKHTVFPHPGPEHMWQDCGCEEQL